MAIPIGLQLYSVRTDCKEDLPGTIAAVAKMGYAGVEFAGYYDYSAQALRRMLDDNGLVCCGTHIGIDALIGERLNDTIEFHQTLGCDFLIVPGLQEERRSSRDNLLKTAQLFNEIAGKLAPHQMYTGYHSHHFDFQVVDGETAWDTLFGNTVKEVVMQVDTSNSMHGGADPVALMNRYPGRALTVHLKEFSPTNPAAVIGEGEVQWNEFFELCETTGNTQWYIVEHETYAQPPLESVRLCFEALKRMGKV